MTLIVVDEVAELKRVAGSPPQKPGSGTHAPRTYGTSNRMGERVETWDSLR